MEIAEWAKVHEAFLRTFLELPHGIPAHDTFNRVFAMLKPATLQAVVLPWLLERRGLPGDWIHLDGKTLRRTRAEQPKLKALHVVSAWAGQTGITLGQVAVDAKSNEITALPELLELLDLHDKIVTTDAMGCQKDDCRDDRGRAAETTSWRSKTISLPCTPRLQAAFATRPAPGAVLAASLLPPKTRGTGATNSARCRCCPRGGICRRRRVAAVAGRALDGHGHPRGVV